MDSFPGFRRISAANSPGQIARQARDALASAAEAGATLPPSIEDAGIPPYDLFGFRDPLGLLVTYTDGAGSDARPRPDNRRGDGPVHSGGCADQRGARIRLWWQGQS